MAKIDNGQMKRIYAIGKSLGIVVHKSHDDELHLLVSALTGKEGVSKLTQSEAAQVIAELERRQSTFGDLPPKEAKPKPTKQHVERDGGITAAQQRMVWYLMYRLAECDAQPSKALPAERLCGIIRKMMGMDIPPKEPMVWISFAQGFQLIEILKKYVASAREKQIRRDAR